MSDEIEHYEPPQPDDMYSAFQREFFLLNPFVAREIYDWFQDRCRPGPSLNGAHATVALIRILSYVWNKPTQLTAFALCYAPGQPALDDIIGHRNMSAAARDLGVSKEAVRQAVEAVQNHFGYERRRDQRSDGVRQAISNARRKQLL